MKAVMLGGETVTRGLYRTQRGDTAGDVIGIVIFGVVAFSVLVVGGSGVSSAVVAAVIAAVGLGVCLPWQFVQVYTEGQSARAWVGTRTSYWWRSRHALTSFAPEDGVLVPAGVGSLASTDEAVDGQVVGVTEPARATDRGRGRYFVTAVEVQGDPYRPRTEHGEAWTSFVEYLGSEDSLVSHVSTVASVTDWDATDHVWLTQNDLGRVENPDQTLVGSYAQLIDLVQERAAHQRTWMVFRFPVGHQLREMSRAQDDDFEGDEKTAVDDDAMRAVVAEQTMAAVERGNMLGLLARPLSSRDLGALCRHLMDPEVSPDDTTGVGENGNVWEGAFPSFTTSKDRRSLIVDGELGKRWMSVWEVPAWRVSSDWLPADFLYPAVTALSGQVNRTFVVTCEIIPTRKARSKAKEDVTSDRAALGNGGAVSDGTNETQALSSQIRLDDLKGSSAAVGVNWSMAVAFHSKSAKEHKRYERRMVGALSDADIERPVRLRYRQDSALALVMPFARAWGKSLQERLG